MNCSCCSAPLPAQGVVCAYCGSRQDVDLQGWATFQAAGPLEDLTCPEGHGQLEAIRLGEPDPVALGRCSTCLGLFLERGALEPLLERAVGRVWETDRRLLEVLAEQPRGAPGCLRYRPCPRCGELMNRQLFGRRSGVIVDRCRDHGTWLDAGELRQLLEWSKAGGGLLEAERQEEANEKAEREEELLGVIGRALRSLLG